MKNVLAFLEIMLRNNTKKNLKKCRFHCQARDLSASPRIITLCNNFPRTKMLSDLFSDCLYLKIIENGYYSPHILCFCDQNNGN